MKMMEMNIVRYSALRKIFDISKISNLIQSPRKNSTFYQVKSKAAGHMTLKPFFTLWSR